MDASTCYDQEYYQPGHELLISVFLIRFHRSDLALQFLQFSNIRFCAQSGHYSCGSFIPKAVSSFSLAQRQQVG